MPTTRSAPSAPIPNDASRGSSNGARRSLSTPCEPGPTHNVTILRGVLSSAPRTRELPSRDEIVNLEVRTRTHDGTTVSVPVAAVPDATVTGLAAGDEVIVVGSVRRRFFRAGGSTQSRTEVVAAQVIPARRRAAAAKAVERALAPLRGS